MSPIIALSQQLLRIFHSGVVRLPAEFAHHLFTFFATTLPFRKFVFWLFKTSHKHLPKQPQTIGALRLDNPVGIAAGFDKNGYLIQALDALGFGFIEVGTVTPKPQPGNPKPRIKKFFKHQAIVNAMGLNNEGAIAVHQRLARLPISLKQKILVSISKNKETAEWLLDLKTCMAAFWFDCGGLTINLSSPNTPGLRGLQTPEDLEKVSALYATLKHKLGPSPLRPSAGSQGIYPLLVCKLSPDMSDEQLFKCLEVIQRTEFGAVILTNTTIQYDKPYTTHFGGGLSGTPLLKRSNDVLRKANEYLKGSVPIIGVGGILKAEDAHQKYELGATAIQIYTGFIFKGPKLLWELMK